MFCSLAGFGQSGNYVIGVKGDTLNRVDSKGQKQGKWVIHVDELRGEPGYEEEGEFRNNRKEGIWRIYSLAGDLTGIEFYRWGNKDGVCQYFNAAGQLTREESWKALNPDKLYDTLEVEDLDHLDKYRTVVVKNEGAAIKNGIWKFYNTETGMIYKTETYTLGKLEILKLRADVMKKQGAAFSLEHFHNNFMRQGFPPIKIVRQAMLGDNSPTL